jgi:hypothetical protein
MPVTLRATLVSRADGSHVYGAYTFNSSYRYRTLYSLSDFDSG